MNVSHIINKLSTMSRAVILVLATSGLAHAFGHYTPGALGLNAASLPPAGFHYTGYNMFYTADTLHDNAGNAIPLNLDLNVFANANQFTYITPTSLPIYQNTKYSAQTLGQTLSFLWSTLMLKWPGSMKALLA